MQRWYPQRGGEKMEGKFYLFSELTSSSPSLLVSTIGSRLTRVSATKRGRTSALSEIPYSWRSCQDAIDARFLGLRQAPPPPAPRLSGAAGGVPGSETGRDRRRAQLCAERQEKGFWLSLHQQRGAWLRT